MRPHNYVELMGFSLSLSLTLSSPAYYGLKRKRRKYRKNITYLLPYPRTINLLIKYFLRCFKFWNFSLLCLVLHSFSAIQNQPLLTYTKYVWFWGCKGHTTVWPYTLQLIQKLPSYSMMTLDLDKSNVCNLHFCLPHPIISFFVKFSMFCEWINKTWIFRNKVMLFLDLIPPKTETHIPTTRYWWRYHCIIAFLWQKKWAENWPSLFNASCNAWRRCAAFF